MIVGIGIDLVDAGRIKRLHNRFPSRFIERVYTEAEKKYASSPEGDFGWSKLATRFAAKEATLKALGSGIGPAGLKEVEVVARQGEAPQIRLHGRAAQIAAEKNIMEVKITLTREGGFACAHAIALSH